MPATREEASGQRVAKGSETDGPTESGTLTHTLPPSPDPTCTLSFYSCVGVT